MQEPQEMQVQSLGREDSGEGNGYPLQYPCLGDPRDRGAWRAAVLGVAQSQTQLKWLSSSSTSILGKEAATHSRILAWKIPWAEEPGGLQSLESQRVEHDLATHIHLRGFTICLQHVPCIAGSRLGQTANFYKINQIEDFHRTEMFPCFSILKVNISRLTSLITLE